MHTGTPIFGRSASVDDARENKIFTTYTALHRANSNKNETTVHDKPHYDESVELMRPRAGQTQISLKIYTKPKKDTHADKKTNMTTAMTAKTTTITMSSDKDSEQE